MMQRMSLKTTSNNNCIMKLMQHQLMIFYSIYNGDINAKVESCNESREYTLGKHGCGEMNANGERKSFLIKISTRKFESHAKKDQN